MSAKGLDPKHVRCVALRVAGHKQKEIARALEVDEATISRWLQLPEVKQTIAETAADAIAAGGTLLKASYSDAVATLLKLMAESDDEGIRLKAATEVLNRVPAPVEDVPLHEIPSTGNPWDGE